MSASGSDVFPVLLIKQCKTELATPIRILFSQLLEQYNILAKGNANVVYLDFSKPFDKVGHEIVLKKSN